MASRLKPEPTDLSSLYESDETAWLEAMSRLVAERRFDELDCQNLSEYLADMARRDRREVLRCLTALILHLLKWDHQPGRRSRSWRLSILKQRQNLEDIFESATLKNYGGEVFAEAYRRAVKLAALEIGRDHSAFPAEPARSFEDVLGGDLAD
jgi:hypothetical protein